MNTRPILTRGEEVLEACPVCLGRGRKGRRRCPLCHGSGRVFHSENGPLETPAPGEAAVRVIALNCSKCGPILPKDPDKAREHTYKPSDLRGERGEPIYCGVCHEGLLEFVTEPA